MNEERELVGADEQVPAGFDIQLVLYDTHCETPDCANGAFTIRAPAALVNPSVTCGECNQPITDCVPV